MSVRVADGCSACNAIQCRWFHLGVNILLRPSSISHWNPLEPVGTGWNPLEPAGTRWNPLEPAGTGWNPLESDPVPSVPPLPPPSNIPMRIIRVNGIGRPNGAFQVAIRG